MRKKAEKDLLWAALGFGILLLSCEPGEPIRPLPLLLFNGQVITAGGSGVPAHIEFAHRYRDCVPETPYTRETDTDDQGDFRLEYDPLPGYSGCFFFRAIPVNPQDGQADSITLTREDLLDLGDPQGTGIVNVIMELRGD